MKMQELHSFTIIHWVGIDVSKKTFDAAVAHYGRKSGDLRKLPVKSFPRTQDGVLKFLAWLEGVSPASGLEQHRVVMESTGVYSTELAVWLHEVRPSLRPAVINPKHSCNFAKSLGLDNTNDSIMAQVLGIYGVEREPAPYELQSGAMRSLRELIRQRRHMVALKTAENNRAGELRSLPDSLQSQKRLIAHIEKEITQIEKLIRRLIKENPEVKKSIDLLMTLDGVGEIVASVILAELGDLSRYANSRQLSAFAGMAPSRKESGTSVHSRTILKPHGNAHVRSMLYLASMAAVRKDNTFSRIYHRLCRNGKAKKAALCAVMRKMLTVMRAVIISGKAYDPLFKTQPEAV